MADFLTHILMADDVLERVESRRILEGIRKHRTLYRLGAQGPDPLFFYNCFPGNGKGVFNELGHAMHRKRTGEFLLAGFSRLQKLSWGREWMELAAYLSGFTCHFTLDRLINPYVSWAEMNWIWSEDGKPVGTTRQAVEISLDVLFWSERRMASACRVKTRKLVDIGGRWPESVESFLLEAFEDIYDVKADKRDLSKILRDYYRGQDLLYDPRGWKKAVVSWLDSFTGGGIMPPKVPYPPRLDDTIDWANKKRRYWTHPFREGEMHRDSADDILSRSVFEAANVINGAFAAILKGEPIDKLFPNISCYTGLPSDE